MQTMIQRLVLASLAVTLLTAAADADSLRRESVKFTSEAGVVSYYKGEVDESGLPHGRGILTDLVCLRCRSLEGEWREGELIEEDNVDGFAERRGFYEGEVNIDGFPEGRGVMWYSDGRRYEGEWRGGDMDGQGVMIDTNGVRYEGGFVGSYLHGEGVLTWPDGRRYEGEFFFGDAINNHGVQTCPDGRRYEGEFIGGILMSPRIRANNRPHNRSRYGGRLYFYSIPYGQGVMTWPDGVRYKGEFEYGVIAPTDGTRAIVIKVYEDWCAGDSDQRKM